MTTPTKRIHGHTTKFGMSPTYTSWHHMMQRCTNPKNTNWSYYGGRGITVCERWRSFVNFLSDMGERPAGKTLDREDGNGNYELSNCRWASRRQQSQNLKSNRLILWQGEMVCFRELGRLTGVAHSTLWARINRGMTVEQAVGNAGR